MKRLLIRIDEFVKVGNTKQDERIVGAYYNGSYLQLLIKTNYDEFTFVVVNMNEVFRKYDAVYANLENVDKQDVV